MLKRYLMLFISLVIFCLLLSFGDYIPYNPGAIFAVAILAFTNGIFLGKCIVGIICNA